MEKAPVKLFGTRESHFTHRVQIALNLKGIDCEFIMEDLANKSQPLLLHNPVHKKVPVLLHGDRPIAESTVILEYIDEVWDGYQLMPAVAYERAVVRFWCHFFDNKLKASFRAMLRSSEDGKDAAVGDFRGNLMVLEGELRDGFFRGRRFFGGDGIGMLDIVAGSGLHWISLYEELTGSEVMDAGSFPLFTAWLDNFKNCDAVRVVVPPEAELIQYVKLMFRQNVVKA